MELNERLRQLRKECGITQETAAEALGVSSQTLSKWERGLCSPDVKLLPRIALLYGCTIDRLFGMDSHTTIQADEVCKLDAVGDYAGIFSLLLKECEEHRDNFQLFLRLLNFASRHELFDHPELPRILPLFYYCERYCPDPDLLFRIIGFCLMLSGKSSNPILRNKTHEFYQRLPSHTFAKERFIHFIAEGDELVHKTKENVRSFFSLALNFLHKWAERAKTTEDQLRLHRILIEIYEILSDGKFCGAQDGIFLNSYHKMAWKHMQLGNEEAAKNCIDAIIRHLRTHLCEESRKDPSEFFEILPGIEDVTVPKLLRRMERHPDLAPFQERITAFREEYETGIQAFKKDNP